MPHRHRLDLIMRHVDRRRPQPGLQRGDVRPRLHPQLRIQIRQRLIHQEHRRLHDRLTHRHPLPLPTESAFGFRSRYRSRSSSFAASRTFVSRSALFTPANSARTPYCPPPTYADTERSSGTPSRYPGPSADDATHPSPRSGSPPRPHPQPRQHPQRRRLPTPRRPHQHQELTISDIQVQILHRLHRRTPANPRRLHVLNPSHACSSPGLACGGAHCADLLTCQPAETQGGRWSRPSPTSSRPRVECTCAGAPIPAAATSPRSTDCQPSLKLASASSGALRSCRRRYASTWGSSGKYTSRLAAGPQREPRPAGVGQRRPGRRRASSVSGECRRSAADQSIRAGAATGCRRRAPPRRPSHGRRPSARRPSTAAGSRRRRRPPSRASPAAGRPRPAPQPTRCPAPPRCRTASPPSRTSAPRPTASPGRAPRGRTSPGKRPA